MAVRVPREVAASLRLAEGAALDLTIQDGAIVLRRRRHDIRELVAAMAGAEPPPLLMEDEPRGSEIW